MIKSFTLILPLGDLLNLLDRTRALVMILTLLDSSGDLLNHLYRRIADGHSSLSVVVNGSEPLTVSAVVVSTLSFHLNC